MHAHPYTHVPAYCGYQFTLILFNTVIHRKNSIQIRANGITVEFCRREEVRQLNGMVVGRTRMCPALKPLLIELRNSYAHGAR